MNEVTPNIIERHCLDKSNFPEGQWTKEPDHVEWFDEKTGYPCVVVRYPFTGHLCGYVGIDQDHRFYGKDFYEINSDKTCKKEPLDVHGGVNYAASGSEFIYHSRVDNDKLWWLGFDCSRIGDLYPSILQYPPTLMRLYQDSKYRTVTYVMMECKNLSEQLLKKRQ